MNRRAARTGAIGTWLFAVVVLGVAAVVVLSFAMNMAADDLRLQVTATSGQPLDHPRTWPGEWVSNPMSADLGPSDSAGRLARADELDHRADRIREAAGVAALLGLVLMLLTERPDGAGSREARDASSPLASTRSNGSV